MSLVVARKLGEVLVIVGDTHLVDPSRGGRLHPLQGMIKTSVLTDALCVSFVGSLYWAEVGLCRAEQSIVDGNCRRVPELLLQVHEESRYDVDFLVASANPTTTLVEIKYGRAQEVATSWLGSAPAFNQFQGFMTGALAPIPRPPNTVTIEMFMQPEPPAEEQSGIYSSAVASMRNVIEDSTIPEVGGFVVPVALHRGRFTYMDYATVLTHPIQFDLMPQQFVVPFGTAEQGGYGFNLMSDQTSSTRGLAVYTLQGRHGVVFAPRNGLLRPTPFINVSPLEFEEAAAVTENLRIHCMWTQPEEYCARAFALLGEESIDLALQEAERAVARSNKVAAGYRCRAIVLARQGNLHAAIEDFSRALALDPTDAATWDNRGITFARLDMQTEAHADFSEAIRIAPGHMRAYEHRAMIAISLGNTEEASADREIVRQLQNREERGG